MSRAAVAHAESAIEERFDLPEEFDPKVPLTALVQSGHNARKRFDATKLDELAASIRQKGVIEPLVVRPFKLNGDTKYEIVAGARRFRAAALAGRTHVPCVIRDYSDGDVLELQIIENIQREDLDPLEEAEGYKALIESNTSRYSAGYIAGRIGRTEKYVWDTLRLLNLLPGARGFLEAGRITRSHAVVLSRLTPAQQGKILHPDGGLWVREAGSLGFDDDVDSQDEHKDLKAISVRELEAHIADHVRFNAKHAAEVAPLEFGAVSQLVEAAQAKPGRGNKVVSITHSYHVKPDARDENERTYTTTAWKRADGLEDSKRCDHAVLGVVAVGEGYGQAFDVCIAKDKCDVHWKADRQAKAKAQKLRDSGQTEKAHQLAETQRQKQEQEQAKRAVEVKRWEEARPVILDALVAALKKTKPGQLGELVATACDPSWNKAYYKTARGRITAKHRADDIVRQAALVVLLNELFRHDAQEIFPRRVKPLGIDVAKILKAHAKQSVAKEKK